MPAVLWAGIIVWFPSYLRSGNRFIFTLKLPGGRQRLTDALDDSEITWRNGSTTREYT